MRTLITNGTIVTADGSYPADVLIDGETIAQIGRDLAAAGVTADETIDATDRYVIPGGIDVHTHMELPFGGTFAKDTFETGTRAAAFGGTTSIVDFAVQSKGSSLRAGLDAWHAKAEGNAVTDYGFHMIMSDVNDATLAEMDVLVAEGVPDFKLFTAYPGVFYSDDGAIFRAMQQTAEQRRADHDARRERDGHRRRRGADRRGRHDRSDRPRAGAQGGLRGRGDEPGHPPRRGRGRARVHRPPLLARGAGRGARGARSRLEDVCRDVPAVPVPFARRHGQRVRGREVRVLATAALQGHLGRPVDGPRQGRSPGRLDRSLPVRLRGPEGARAGRLPEDPQRPARRGGPGRPAPRRWRGGRPDQPRALGRDHLDRPGQAVRDVPDEGRDRGRLRRRHRGLRPGPGAHDLGGDPPHGRRLLVLRGPDACRALPRSCCRAVRSSSATASSPGARATAGSSSGRRRTSPA